MEALVDRIVTSDDAFFKHQQSTEDELTEEQKRTIVSELFDANKSLFLQRYIRFVNKEDCPLFDSEDDFVVKHLIAQVLKKQSGEATSAKSIRNRRFLALQKMKARSNYFSDEKMRERDPLLYDKMIGRYLTDEDRLQLRPTVAHSGGWAGMMSQFEESMEVAERRNEHDVQWDRGENNEKFTRMLAHVSNKYMDDSDFEVELEEDEDVMNSQEESPKQSGRGGMNMNEMQGEMETLHRQVMDECDDEDDDSVDVLRHDFVAFMEERFLAGKDAAFFDYSTVDQNEDYDDRDPIKERDLEEKWFDED